MKKRSSSIKILFSEGSSLSAREALSSLGPLGYRIDICDPDPACISRFSKYVHKYYRCPAIGRDPLGYLHCIEDLLGREQYDVLVPVHEQAYLFSRLKERLQKKVGIAITDFESFQLLQSKVQFLRLLAELQIPFPKTHFCATRSEIENQATFPAYIKTDYGTASMGVWKVSDRTDLMKVIALLENRSLLDGHSEVLVQEVAPGNLEIGYACFNEGNLIALHCCRRLVEGSDGSSSSKIGVDRPVVAGHFSQIGRHLHWHGSLAVDYIYDQSSGIPCYIDASPRLVEPMNATINGINIPELLVRLSLSEDVSNLLPTKGFKSHQLLTVLLGVAQRGCNRADLVREIAAACLGIGIYADSTEELTNVKDDFLSIIPLAFVFFRLMVNPGRGSKISTKTVNNYALTESAIAVIRELKS